MTRRSLKFERAAMAAVLALLASGSFSADRSKFVTFDTAGANEPALLAAIERLKVATAKGDAEAIKVMVAPDFKRYAFGISGYHPDIQIDDSSADGRDEPGKPWNWIYGLFHEGGELPSFADREETRRRIQKMEDDFRSARDGYLVSALSNWLKRSPAGRVRQMRSAACLPADPVIPRDVERKIMRTKKDGVVESRYAYALRELKVTEKADPFSRAVAALRPREIFEVDGTNKVAKAYHVVLRDGRRGWAAMDPDKDMAPIFKDDYEGICFRKLGGEWKIVIGSRLTL